MDGGSTVEFHKVIEPLTDPTSFGGKAEDAFHVVCPTLPGYGFSRKANKDGMGVEKNSYNLGRSDGPDWLRSLWSARR